MLRLYGVKHGKTIGIWRVSNPAGFGFIVLVFFNLSFCLLQGLGGKTSAFMFNPFFLGDPGTFSYLFGFAYDKPQTDADQLKTWNHMAENLSASLLAISIVHSQPVYQP